MQILTLVALPTVVLSCIVLQAENATFQGPGFDNFEGYPEAPANWIGSGYIDWGNTIGDYVGWQVNSDGFAQGSLSFRYALQVGHGDRPKQLFVNGQYIQNVAFPGTTGWQTFVYLPAINVDLVPGINYVNLTQNMLNQGPNIDALRVCISTPPGSPPMPLMPPPPPPPTTFYIRGARSQIVFGTNDECTLELASGATSLTSTCPINAPSSRRLEDASNDSDRVTQLETRIAQLEMGKAEMKEQIQFLTTELKMLKEQRKAP